VGENPCDIDRLFRRIKQFGGHGRQGGGVSAIEIALWDLAARPMARRSTRCWWQVPRQGRVYCDTTRIARAGTEMASAEGAHGQGFTFLKMTLG